MNIALCTDENFSMPALVCIASIFKNNVGVECHIYVLTDGLSDLTLEKFVNLGRIYDQKIDILVIDKHRFDGLTVNERFPVSMYYRFLLPEMLPGEERVLYLDCDTIVRQPLADVYQTSLEGKALAAVVSQSCDSILWTNQLKLKSPYFNSGVLLMNLEYWRKNNSLLKLVEWIVANPEKCMLPDQNALNVVFDGVVEYLDYGYNFQERWTRDLEGCDVHYSKWGDICQAGKDPSIVHFCDAEKPWFVECRNPFKQEWRKYAMLHEFFCYEPLKRYGIEYQISVLIDKVGLRLRYWAEKWQKRIFMKIQISR